MVQHKDKKQTAAVDLSKRLKDLRSLNDGSSLKGESSSNYFFIFGLSYLVECSVVSTVGKLHFQLTRVKLR